MYNYKIKNYQPSYNYPINHPNRQGFIAPFVLGGITGGLLAPNFYRPYYPVAQPYPPRPYYYY